jgi:hypothetical protein
LQFFLKGCYGVIQFLLIILKKSFYALLGPTVTVWLCRKKKYAALYG